MTDPLKALKEQYDQIPIPKELDSMITQALQQDRQRLRRTRIRNTCLSAACVCALFIGSINLSPAVHQALAEVPVLGALVEVCTFRGYNISQDNFQAKISIPQVAGLRCV